MDFPPTNNPELTPQEVALFLDLAMEFAPEEKAQIVHPTWHRVTYLTDNGQVSIQVPKIFGNLNIDPNGEIDDDEDDYVSDELSVTVAAFDDRLGDIQPATLRRYSVYMLDGTSDFRESTEMYDLSRGEILRRAPVNISEELEMRRNGAFDLSRERFNDVLRVLASIDPTQLK